MNFAMKTEILYPFVLILSLTRLQVGARGVNISSVWFLPEEGFPVFYRYFNDKVTWNEAEAVCGHHHTDLLTVQTSAQMDAARAYLKEIDVTDNVWIGLHRESPEKQFSWTNGEKLSGDGYWLEPIPKTNEKLCGALDPASDFRWNTYYCGGPQVASFVCELPVPEWAKKEDGCMITSLPSLTVTYIPEMEIVQLFSDCGLDGTRRIACKGGVNREEIVRRLSCDEDVSTIFSKSTTDTVKDVITLQSAWSNDLKGAQQDGTKSWATRLPQTRHKRMANRSDTQSEQPNNSTQTETLTQTVMSTEKPTVLNVPSRNFPHSPADRDVPSTVSPAPPNGTSTPSEMDNTTASSPKVDKPVVSSPLNTSSVAALPPTLIAKLKTPVEEAKSKFVGGSTQSPEIKANLTENTKRPVQGIGKEIPVLVISNETSNDSLPSNATTSENPPIVFMTDDKEGMSEPYLLPMGRDVIVNNPSLSPMEVIDVDLIELENLTTTTATPPPPPTEPAATPSPITTILTSTPTTPFQKSIMGVHPLRLGEKNAVGENTSASVATTTGTTSTSTTMTTTTSPPVPTSTTLSPTENLQQISQNNLEVDNDGEDLDMPQRPSRGRLITRSNIPSFYPYFFNKVLG